jgi:hypothetical protein
MAAPCLASPCTHLGGWKGVDHLALQQQRNLLFSRKLGRLEMKPHKPKKQGQNKSEKEGENKG